MLILPESRNPACIRQGSSVSHFTIRNSLFDIRYSFKLLRGGHRPTRQSQPPNSYSLLLTSDFYLLNSLLTPYSLLPTPYSLLLISKFYILNSKFLALWQVLCYSVPTYYDKPLGTLAQKLYTNCGLPREIAKRYLSGA